MFSYEDKSRASFLFTLFVGCLSRPAGCNQVGQKLHICQTHYLRRSLLYFDSRKKEHLLFCRNTRGLSASIITTFCWYILHQQPVVTIFPTKRKLFSIALLLELLMLWIKREIIVWNVKPSKNISEDVKLVLGAVPPKEEHPWIKKGKYRIVY